MFCYLFIIPKLFVPNKKEYKREKSTKLEYIYIIKASRNLLHIVFGVFINTHEDDVFIPVFISNSFSQITSYSSKSREGVN